MLAVPVSFVSEHIETLDEMDVEYRELAEESGICHWRRVPALNTNPVFVDDLADAVLEALPFAGSMAGSNPSDAMVPLGAPPPPPPPPTPLPVLSPLARSCSCCSRSRGILPREGRA